MGDGLVGLAMQTPLLTMNSARRGFNTKKTKFAQGARLARLLCASLAFFVVNRFHPLAGQGMSA
jgi:hypothetical protein